MSYAAEIERAGARFNDLLQVTLPSGEVRRYAAHAPDEGAAGPFDGRIVSIGPVRRAGSSPWAGWQPSGYQVALARPDSSQAWDPDTLLGATIARRLAANGYTLTIHTGVVVAWDFGVGAVNLEVADLAERYLGQDARWGGILTNYDLPGLDNAYANQPMPVVAGDLDSRCGGGSQGAVKCVRLGACLYGVSSGAMAGVPRVYDGGDLLSGGYAVRAMAWAPGINGYLTVIDFDAPPAGEVTVDVRGLTVNLDGTGPLITNAVDVAELLRNEAFGIPDSAVDAAAIATARDFAQAWQLNVAGVASGAVAPREILGQILGSVFLMGGITAGGLLAYWAPPIPAPTAGGVSISHFDMVAGSFKPALARDRLANEITVTYRPNWANGSDVGSLTVSDAQSQADQGVKRQTISLPWVASPVTAAAVARLLLLFAPYARDVSWREAMRHSASLELGGQVAVSHPWGPSADGAGWAGREFMLTGLGVDGQGLALEVTAWDLGRANAATLGAGLTLPFDLPGAVI